MIIPKGEWVWYGYPGHLVVAKRCAYHLCTRIGDKLVSTVGAFFPNHHSPMETIGSGDDDYFETFTFECLGEDEYGNPQRGEELASIRYKTSIEAERGHRVTCLLVATEDTNLIAIGR